MKIFAAWPPRKLIVEIKGYEREEVKQKSPDGNLWVPSINNTRQYGRTVPKIVYDIDDKVWSFLYE